MEGNNLIQLSSNSLARFKKADRLRDIAEYKHFKTQFENYLQEQQILQIKGVYQHGICGKNSFGHTIVVDRIGNIKIQNLFKTIDSDDLVRYFNQRMLYLAEKVLQEGEQVIWVIDLSGKIMQLASKKILDALQAVISNAAKYFPLMLHKLIFVNAPMLFDTIWAKVVPSIPKATLDKIILLGDDIDTLYDYAPQRILPDFLGGDVDEETFLYGQSKQNQEGESSDEEEVDFSQLKMALNGMKFSGNSLKSVSQTPLNTEADDK